MISNRKEIAGDDFLSKLQNFSINFADQTLDKILSSILKSVIGNDDLKKMLSEIPDFKKDDPILKNLGIENYREQINANKEVIILFVLTTLFTEMENIATEARESERIDR